MTDERKLNKSLEWTGSFKENFESDGWGQRSLSTLCKLAEEYLKASDEMPEVEIAHTYASENADIYRSYDRGQIDMKKRCSVAHLKSKEADRKELERKLDIPALAKLIDEKVWERHPGCKCLPKQYKENPKNCCYLNCATAIRNLILEGK